MPRRVSLKYGFTLVELSIVLVIIGLLLGGVIIGKDMIRSAQLRSVVTDVQGYLAASMMFQDKYQCLPGDCANATTFFSGVTNGNGDTILSPASAANAVGEVFGAWQQLALIGYVAGVFTGKAGPANQYDALAGVNVPASKLPNSTYSFGFPGLGTGNTSGVLSATSNYYDGAYRNVLYFGTKYPGELNYAAILSPAQAYAIDQKIDDGIPGTGTIRTMFGNTYAPNCSTSGSVNTNPTASAYNISYSGIACQLLFITGW